MPAQGPSPDTTRGLRASLLEAPRPAQPAEPAAPTPALPSSPPPTAPELLGATPNLQRLCESYHRSHSAMAARSRRQRLGIALLVAAICVGSLVLYNQGVVTTQMATSLVVAVAVSSCVALGVMAAFWMRDDRRLRATQGERFLRALNHSCTLSGDRLAPIWAGSVPATRLFFDCYEVWRGDRPRASLVTRLRGA